MTIAEQVKEKETPNILLKTSVQQRSSNGQRVRDIEDINRRWTQADHANRIRLFENLRAFFDINGGAWDREALAEMRRQGRHPVSFNIAEQKLRTLAGSIQSEKWDFEFLPTNVKESSLTQGIKHKYYKDKEQYNYSASENKTLMRGLIQIGIEEMEIEYDIRPTGAIAFNSRLPGTVIKDPYWLSDRLKDWTRAIKHSWMTPKEIIEYFESDDSRLQLMARLDEISGEVYEPVGDVDILQNMPETWGSKLLIIEYRWLETIKTTRLYGKVPGGRWVPFPLDVSESEARALMKFYEIESAEDMREYPYIDRVLKYTTICPSGSTDAILSEGNHPVQCDFIGFFPFSAAREMGVDKGVMQSLLDIQRSLDYRESKKEDVIAAAAAGAKVVDIDALPNGQRSLEELKQNITKPDYVLGVQGDPSKVIAIMPTGEVPKDIWNDIHSLIDMFDRVSPVTPALEGAESKGESGILFEMRHSVTKLGTLILYDNWQGHLTDKAEAWYNQARITYKGFYEEVPLHEKPGSIEFGAPLGDGKYLNSIETLPRARVVVTLSTTSPTEQMSKRAMYYDMAKMLSANPEMAKQQFRIVMNRMIDTIEMPADEKERYKEIAKIQEQIDILELFTQREGLISQMLQSKVGQAQAQAMLKQMQGQMMGGMQGGEEGAPPAISRRQPELTAPAGELATQTVGERAPGQAIPTSRGEFQP